LRLLVFHAGSATEQYAATKYTVTFRSLERSLSEKIRDQDNQIDIILSGDLAAARRITFVDVPSVAPYSPLYNPGGPGNQPTPKVRYSAPSPPQAFSGLFQAVQVV